jgi:hypothetical protein
LRMVAQGAARQHDRSRRLGHVVPVLRVPRLLRVFWFPPNDVEIQTDPLPANGRSVSSVWSPNRDSANVGKSPHRELGLRFAAASLGWRTRRSLARSAWITGNSEITT